LVQKLSRQPPWSDLPLLVFANPAPKLRPLADASSPLGNVTYLADTVLHTRYFESGGEVRKAVSVLKRRSGKHESSIRELRLGPEGLSVTAPLTEFHGVMTGLPRRVAAQPSLRDEPSE
jgi:circadian clock protein KaiC